MVQRSQYVQDLCDFLSLGSIGKKNTVCLLLEFLSGINPELMIEWKLNPYVRCCCEGHSDCHALMTPETAEASVSSASARRRTGVDFGGSAS